MRSLPPAPTPWPSYASIATFGDSITVGNVATTAANRWANIVAAGVGGTLLNAGISGTVLQNSNDSGGSPRVDNGRDRYSSAILGSNKKAAVYLAYGFNDARYVAAPTTFNVTQYLNDYREMLNGLILGGYARADIYAGTPYYISDAGLASGSTGFAGQTRAGFEEYVQAALDVAAEYGVKSCNLYAYLRDNGFAATTTGDNIHPDNTGHALIATAWREQSIVTNTLAAPSTTAATATGQTVTVTAATSGAASYEYALLAGSVEIAANTSGTFASVTPGTYNAKARAVFAGGTKGPWTFTTAAVTVSASGGGAATLGQTENYAATPDETLLTATAPTQGAWTFYGYSNGQASIGGGAIKGPTSASQVAVAALASTALGTGVFSQVRLLVRSNQSGTRSAGPIVRAASATSDYLVAFYNGQNIRLFKSIAGTLTQIGTTYTAVLTIGTTYTLRLEASANVQTVYLDGTAIISATEPESNLSSLGNGLGIRLQTGASTTYSNTTGPVVSAVTVGSV